MDFSMSELKQAALEYAQRGWHVFPCKPDGKIPLTPNGQNAASLDQIQIELWWDQWPQANIGIFLAPSGLMAIDVDSYKPDCEWDAFIGGKDFDPQCVQRSARGGTHYIFKADPNQTFKPPCKGVDMKHNGYIMAHPSTFEGKRYEWIKFDEPTQFPEWLTTPQPKFPIIATEQKSLSDMEQEVISGTSIYPNLLSISYRNARNGKDQESNEAELNNLMDRAESKDQRWADRKNEVSKLAKSAAEKISKDQPAILVHTGLDNFVRDSGGRIQPSISNIFTMLITSEVWKKVFAYDEFSNRKIIIAKPPYKTGNPKFFKPRDLTDRDYIHVMMWIERNWKRCNKQDVIDAINAACEAQVISPVKHYLQTLDTPADPLILNLWLEKYFGVVPSDAAERLYIEQVSRKILIQAVARPCRAGCKADLVLVLEGGQGIGKSTGIRALCGVDWFGDALPPMGSKDASDYLRGKWIIELSEMAFQRKAEVEMQKAFISRQEERYRPAYGREEVVYQRRCVFIATTNRDDWALDETGNRRFVPVRATKVDVAGLKRDRDELWAAAVTAYNSGEQWWFTEEMAAYANGQTEQRQESDVWVEQINIYLQTKNETTIREAFSECFKQDGVARDITKQMERRMTECLIKAGFERSGKYTSGNKRNQTRFVRLTGASDG